MLQYSLSRDQFTDVVSSSSEEEDDGEDELEARKDNILPLLILKNGRRQRR